MALRLLAEGSLWPFDMVERGGWATHAPMQQLRSWVSSLEPTTRAYAAAHFAVACDDRDFLALAEAAHAKDNVWALEALVPAWWRFGKSALADRGWKRYARSPDRNTTHILVTMAARGGRWELATDLIPECFAPGADSNRYPLVGAALAAYADGQDRFMARLMTSRRVAESRQVLLATELLRATLERGEPRRYFELLTVPGAAEHPEVTPCALAHLEAAEPAAAVVIAEALCSMSDDATLQAAALATLHRLVPTKSDRRGLPLTSRAACGIAVDLSSASRWECGQIGLVTPDRTLAVAALTRALEDTTPSAYLRASQLVALADLAGRERADAILEGRLEASRAFLRDEQQEARSDLVRCAPQVGRADFALSLVGRGRLRNRYLADIVTSAAEVGDYGTALDVLAKLDKEHRALTALVAVGKAQHAFLDGPRAIPLRAIDATYARNLIAAGDRIAVEKILALARPAALDDEVRVEIDAFLEGRPI